VADICWPSFFSSSVSLTNICNSCLPACLGLGSCREARACRNSLRRAELRTRRNTNRPNQDSQGIRKPLRLRN
jgi:hypothetical protein